MFDVDQDDEVLAVIQAAAAYRKAERDGMSAWGGFRRVCWRLDDALEAFVREYGKDALVYDPAAGPPLCIECGVNLSDPPSELCPGCEAYRDNQRCVLLIMSIIEALFNALPSRVKESEWTLLDHPLFASQECAPSRLIARRESGATGDIC